MSSFKRRRSDYTKGKAPPKIGAPETHGAFSKDTQMKYSDLRTRQGARLAAIEKGLVESLGGQECVSVPQSIIIGNIKAKLIVIFQISEFADKQKSVVDQKTGDLIPALAKNFLTYSESLRRDLETLQKFSKIQIPGDLYEKWRTSFFASDNQPKKDKE